MLSETLLQKREIRIFVSSTFLDLKKERDYLIKNVLPSLKEFGKKRGVIVTMLDLRWGITPSEAKDGKVLEACLDEINFSRPFFIGIIGNRYGWCPKQDQISWNKSLESKYPWIKEDVVNKMSCTEMEIQFGVLRNTEKMNALFFRKECKRKQGGNVQKLLEKIESDGRYPLIPYKDIKELGNKVLSFFKKKISEFPIIDDTAESERWSSYSDLTRYYQPNRDYLDVLNDFLSSDRNILEIHGGVGSGKSSLLAYWLLNNLNDSGTAFADGRPVFWPQKSNSDYLDLRNYGPFTKNKQPLIVLDHNKPYYFSNKNEYASFKIIITVSIDEDYFSHMPYNKRSYTLLHVSGFGNNLDRDCIGRKRNYLKDYLGYKKLESVQVNRIVRSRITTNPSILKTLLDELNRTAINDTLQDEIDDYLSGDNADFFRAVVKNLIKDYNCIGVLALLATEEKGISEEELIKYLSIKPLHWSIIYLSIRPYLFINSEGKMSFRDYRIRDAVMDTTEAFRFLQTFDKQQKNKKTFSNHLRTYWEQYVDTEDILEFGNPSETGFHMEMITRYLSSVDSANYDWETLKSIGYYIKNDLEDSRSAELFFMCLLKIQRLYLPNDSEYLLCSLGPLSEMGTGRYAALIFDIVKKWSYSERKLYWLRVCIKSSRWPNNRKYLHEAQQLVTNMYGVNSKQMIDFLIWEADLSNVTIKQRRDSVSLARNILRDNTVLAGYKMEELSMMEALSKCKISRIVVGERIIKIYYNRDGSKQSIRVFENNQD